MRRPSGREFRRHRAVEQGRSLPPPAPQASLSLFCEKNRFHVGRAILSQNGAGKFHLNPVPRQMRSPGDLQDRRNLERRHQS
jgi:hypothetical protein